MNKEIVLFGTPPPSAIDCNMLSSAAKGVGRTLPELNHSATGSLWSDTVH